MSNTQFAFLPGDRLPSRAALQSSIDALGYALQLHPDLDLRKDSGFSPCVLEGVPDVGFELFVEPTADVTDGDEEFEEIAAGNDTCIGMTWRSSMKDCACAMIVSCALARDFGAVISYEGGPAEPWERLLETVNEMLRQSRPQR